MIARATSAVQAGRPAEAILPLQQALSRSPANAALQYDLGSLCLQAGRVAEATAAFKAALAAKPDFAMASLRLGLALQAQGELAEALAAFRHATTLLPSLVEARFRAGALLETLGARTEAIASFRRAAASAPKTSLSRLAKARALLAEDHDGAAEVALRQLLALDPDNGVANETLATVLANAGRFQEAAERYQRAIKAAPMLAGSYYDMVRCRRISQDDTALLTLMRAALATPGLPAEARLKVHLALGKAADDLGEYAAAMDHFDAADHVRRAFGAFDPLAFAARVDRLIAYFTPGVVKQAAAANDATPVLILGLPRSGTTLVEQILSCHPAVHAGGELPFWTERGALWEQAGGGGPAFLAGAGLDYLSLLHALAPKAVRVTDKMPLNVLWAGLVHLALPRATIVHCRRSPIDTALSIHRTYFNQHVAFPTGGPELVSAVRAIERLAAHWRAVLPADRFVEVEYEQLAADPEPEIRRLVAACGLPWDGACLQPERNERVVKTPSKWQVRQAISTNAVGAWRRYEPWLGALAALVP